MRSPVPRSRCQERLAQEAKVLWKRAFEYQHCAGDGVLEGQAIGMQRLPSEVLQRAGGLRREPRCLGLEAGSVHGVTQERMTDRAEMDADLVCPPGFQPAGQKA